MFDGSVLPDYVTFCLDCHSNAIGNIKAEDWESDPHGKKRAGYSGLGIHIVGTATLAELDGGGSSDPDGDDIDYAWGIATKPAGSAATLTGASEVDPTFVADLEGSYTVVLTVRYMEDFRLPVYHASFNPRRIDTELDEARSIGVAPNVHPKDRRDMYG